MKFATLFCALLASVAPLPAFASCATYGAQVTQTTGASYNPAELTDLFVNISLNAPSNPASDCASTPVVIASRGGVISLSNGASALNFLLVSSSATDGVTSSTFNLSSGGESDLVRTGNLSLPFLKLLPGQFVQPGEYTADLQLQVGDGAPVLFAIAVRVEPAMRFISGSGGTTSLSLGEVTAGAQITDQFFYRTNSALSVSVLSENHGVLVHSLGKGFGEIPYAAFLSGKPLTLSAPSVVTLDLRNGPLQSEEMRVAVEPQPARYAGIYRDTLTLEFTPF